jgi:hypothetical protein
MAVAGVGIGALLLNSAAAPAWGGNGGIGGAGNPDGGQGGSSGPNGPTAGSPGFIVGTNTPGAGGAAGTAASPNGGTGGNGSGGAAGGGGGGGGYFGFSVSGYPFSISTSVVAGNGGVGGLGVPDDGDGGGGAGGFGVIAQNATGTTNNNLAIIAAGNGGDGGARNGDAPGAGGDGGIALYITSTNGMTFTNSGNLVGGNGGNANIITSQIGNSGGNGGAGASLIGNNIVLLNAGQIIGGTGGMKTQGSFNTITDGMPGDAVDISGNNNTLGIEAGSSFTGNVVASGSGNALALGESAASGTHTFALSTFGTQYTGFAYFEKINGSAEILTGSLSATMQTIVAGGQLFLGDNVDTGVIANGVLVNGGTFVNNLMGTVGVSLTMAGAASATNNGLVSGNVLLNASGANFLNAPLGVISQGVTLGASATATNEGNITGNVLLNSAGSAFDIIPGSSMTGTVSAVPGSVTILDGAATVDFSTLVQGASINGGNVLKQGNGTWIIDKGSITGYSSFNVTAGTIQVGTTGGPAALVQAGQNGNPGTTGILLNGGTLVVAGSGSVVGGTGSFFTLFGGGGGVGVMMNQPTTLNNSGVIAGGGGGTGNNGLGLGVGGTGGAGIVVANGGSVVNNSTGSIQGGAGGFGASVPGQQGGALQYNAAGSLTNFGSISGSVSMSNAANMVTVFSGSVINGDLSMGTSTSSVLALGGTGSQNYSSVVTGTTTLDGELVLQGSGTWTLDKVVTPSGGSIVSSGTLDLTAASTFTGLASGNPSGTGLTINGGTVYNLGANIVGGTGTGVSLFGTAGGTGVVLNSAGTFTNSSTITGGGGGTGNNGLGSGVGGMGGAGVNVTGGGTVLNNTAGVISGGAGGFGVSASGNPGDGVDINSAGALINKGTINGGVSLNNNPTQVTLFTGSVIHGNLFMDFNTGAVLTLDGAGNQNYSAAATGTTTLRGNLVKQGTGTWTMTQVLSNSGGSTSITSGALIEAVNGAVPSGALTLGTNSSVGNLTLASNTHTATATAVTIHTGSKLDIGNNSLAINYGAATDPVSTVAGYVKSGYNGGTWTGTGIASSVASGNPSALAVGYADGNTDAGTAAGPNQIVVKYTLAGDTNLDGLVSFQDLVNVVQNFNKAGTDWAQGNFLFAGSTSFADLVTVVQNFNKVLTPAGSSWETIGGSRIGTVGPTDAQLPEPGIGVLGILATGLMMRRRRHFR